MNDDDYWFEPIGGIGSLHDLQEPDPRNPRLIGLKSVSYAAAVAMGARQPQSRPIGFHRPMARK